MATGLVRSWWCRKTRVCGDATSRCFPRPRTHTHSGCCKNRARTFFLEPGLFRGIGVRIHDAGPVFLTPLCFRARRQDSTRRRHLGDGVSTRSRNRNRRLGCFSARGPSVRHLPPRGGVTQAARGVCARPSLCDRARAMTSARVNGGRHCLFALKIFPLSVSSLPVERAVSSNRTPSPRVCPDDGPSRLRPACPASRPGAPFRPRLRGRRRSLPRGVVPGVRHFGVRLGGE